MANKLPNEEQDEIFNYKNIECLLQAILKGNDDKLNHYSKAGEKGIEKIILLGENTEYDNNFNSRITHLAALLVNEGIKICIDQYRSKIEQDSTLNQATIDKLKNASEICDAIAFKLYSPKIELIAEKEKLTYLFNLNKITEVSINEPSGIPGSDNKKLIEFLKGELTKWLGKELGQLRQITTEFIEINNNNKIIRCFITTRFGKMFKCDLKLNSTQKDMIVTYYDIDHESPIFEDNLIVNVENNNCCVYLDSKT